MPGYKRTVLERDGAIGFWTFDGDAYDQNTRRLTQLPAIIIDETGLENHAIVHTDQDTYDCYRMGYPSLVSTEKYDNQSMAFAPLGKVPLYSGLYPKSYLEIPMATVFNGSTFSFEAIVNKTNEDSFDGALSFTRPLLKREGVIEIRWNHGALSSSDLCVVLFNDETDPLITNYSAHFGKNTHIFVNWKTIQTSPGEFTGTVEVFLNAELVITKDYYYFNNTPSLYQTTGSWFIAGYPSAQSTAPHYSDRNTSMLILDQIAIYDKWLAPETIADHYRKTLSYDHMILNDNPFIYCNFDDEFYDLEKTSRNRGSGSHLVCYLTGEFLRNQPMSPAMPFSSSTYFANDGMAYIINPNDIYQSPIFNINGDYTVEMFVKILSSTRGVICALQSEKSPHNGILIQANLRNNQLELGSIQFSENVGLNYTLNSNSAFRYNDGYFHHIAITRNKNTIRLYIDGTLHDTKEAAVVQNTHPSKIYLMGSMPGKLNVAGNISEFALYNKSLQPQQIKARSSYGVTYKISGNTTLRGVPFRATIRVYNNLTGQLIKEVFSDPNTGNYTIYLNDNSKIDLMIFGYEDTNVKYRAFGPIIPSDYVENYIS